MRILKLNIVFEPGNIGWWISATGYASSINHVALSESLLSVADYSWFPRRIWRRASNYNYTYLNKNLQKTVRAISFSISLPFSAGCSTTHRIGVPSSAEVALNLRVFTVSHVPSLCPLVICFEYSKMFSISNFLIKIIWFLFSFLFWDHWVTQIPKV